QGLKARGAATNEIVGHWRLSDEDLLKALRGVFQREGHLSTSLMRKADAPCARLYRERFGSLFTAYRMVGCEPDPRRFRGQSKRWLARERAMQSALAAESPDELSQGRDERSEAQQNPIVDDEHGHTSA